MRKPEPSPRPASRRLACGRCGAVFSCSLSGDCWCAGEDVRLPLPPDEEDCLCPACLRTIAARHRVVTNPH